uniref:Uncharacterized protein n=1 Tax=Thermomicrobium roseum TaxID=500 RepID=A0A7C5RTD9_THERO
MTTVHEEVSPLVIYGEVERRSHLSYRCVKILSQHPSAFLVSNFNALVSYLRVEDIWWIPLPQSGDGQRPCH